MMNCLLYRVLLIYIMTHLKIVVLKKVSLILCPVLSSKLYIIKVKERKTSIDLCRLNNKMRICFSFFSLTNP